jgi:ribosomal-protein-alanine N-acetyltransferase
MAGCISVTPKAGCGAQRRIGYWLGQAHWRQGIVSEALALVTTGPGPTLPQTTRLWMPIFARNSARAKWPCAAGYGQEASCRTAVRKAGEAIDVVTVPARPSRTAGPASPTNHPRVN